MQHVDYLEHDAALFGGLKKAVKKAAKGVGGVAKGAAKAATSVASTVARPVGELSKSPLWNVAQTGVSFIPGVGQGVSAGMAAAAALGRGESARDIALSAARGAIPGGPLAQAAFDVAVGAARGQRLDEAALGAAREQLPGGAAARAAFDAGVALAQGSRVDSAAAAAARAELGRAGRDVFDAALRAANVQRGFPRRGDQVVFPALGRGPQAVARALATQPGFRGLRTNQIAQRMGLPTQAARQGAAAWLQKFGGRAIGVRDVGDFDSLESAADRLGVELPEDLDADPPVEYDHLIPLPPVGVSRDLLLKLYNDGPPDLRKAIQAHGLLPMLAQNVGELDGKGGWTIRSGDLPYLVAQKVTGDSNRWQEIPLVNPGMAVVHKKDSAGKVTWSGIEPWHIGKTINLPPSWIVGAMPEIVVPSLPASIPGAAAAPSIPGGPPFPPPSVYPTGYPTAYYIVQAGDTGTKIAQRITGDGNRWKELRDMNPSTADSQIGMKANVGQKLHLPPAWVKPAPVVVPPPVVPQVPPGLQIEPPEGFAWPPEFLPSLPPPTASFPLPPEAAPPLATPPPLASAPPLAVPPLPVSLPPTPAPATTPAPAAPVVTGTTQQIAAVQVQLGYFFKAHSDATWAVPAAPFGTVPSDYSGVWDQRSFQAMAAFQAWWNGRKKSPALRTDGMPDAQSIAALRAQVDEDLGVQKSGGGAVAGGTASGGGGDIAPILLGGGALYLLFR
ncbi:MAG: LysM peptidoglycan-binding domain-containing protein [Polyangiaceae bacterium]|nr:LysM peptidoglycan-binding domain-containing protein [Polyangiaceae bacterium]